MSQQGRGPATPGLPSAHRPPPGRMRWRATGHVAPGKSDSDDGGLSMGLPALATDLLPLEGLPILKADHRCHHSPDMPYGQEGLHG